MNGQNFGEHVNNSIFDEPSDQVSNNPAADSDTSAEKMPVLAGLIQQTPTGNGTIPTSNLMEQTIAHESIVGDFTPYNAAKQEPVTREAVAVPNTGSSTALLDHSESEHLRTRWNEIQGKFVDEPRAAVQQADALVSEVVDKITQMFSTEHGSLESQWKQGNDVSTEDLRKALQHYRSFFNRLVV
jgi:hypothetical protein